MSGYDNREVSRSRADLSRLYDEAAGCAQTEKRCALGGSQGDRDGVVDKTNLKFFQTIHTVAVAL